MQAFYTWFFEILLGSEQLQNMNGLKGKILEGKTQKLTEQKWCLLYGWFLL